MHNDGGIRDLLPYFPWLILLWVGSANGISGLRDNPKSFQIGGVLSNNGSRSYFKDVIEQLNFKPHYVPQGMSLVATAIEMDPNPIRTAIKVCEDLIKQQVYAVVVSHPPSADLSPAAVSYTSGFYHIPVIGISSRDSAFSDKNIHVSFLRTVPPYSHQADVWVEILKHFKYQKVIFLHSSDTDGRSILGKFQNNAQNLEDDVEIKIELVIELEPGADSYIDRLAELKNAQARVYLLYASAVDADAIFRGAAALNLTGEGHVWLLTEQLLQSPEIPQGAFGLKLLNAGNETAHIRDSLHVLAAAIKEMNSKDNITEAPKDCSTSGATWDTGKKLFEYIKNEELLDGETGKVAFDESGDRINAEYNVINVRVKGSLTSIGHYLYSKEKKEMDLYINDSRILWAGNSPKKPDGVMIPTHLRILTIEEIPFVFVRKVENKTECRLEEELCPHFNTTEDPVPVNYCCRGYCIDLLKQLRLKRNFTFNLALSPDGQFGSYAIKNGTTKKEWTGLIAELVNERADMIVAPLTINPERAQAIEFSKPFKYQGITILVKRAPRKPTLVSFLQPFRGNLWILVMLSVHVVALVLYLLDRFSPFGRYRLANMDGTEEDALNLSSAIWFAWGVLLNSGIGEGTPRSFAARVLGIVWAGFAMIIVASYTANLAAFLVLDRPKTVFSGIHDNRLRNPTESFNYSTVKGSAVDMYFRRQVELSNMYRVMERRNYDTAQAAIDDIKRGILGAFIWDSSRLQYEAARNCELITSGELFGRSGYAIGLQKGSPWSNDVTLDILDFHESGFMEQLDKKWIIEPEPDPSSKPDACPTEEKIPTTLGLENMDDAFILIAADSPTPRSDIMELGVHSDESSSEISRILIKKDDIKMVEKRHCGVTAAADDSVREFDKLQKQDLIRLQRKYRLLGGDASPGSSNHVPDPTEKLGRQKLIALRLNMEKYELSTDLDVADSPQNHKLAKAWEVVIESILLSYDEYCIAMKAHLEEVYDIEQQLDKIVKRILQQKLRMQAAHGMAETMDQLAVRKSRCEDRLYWVTRSFNTKCHQNRLTRQEISEYLINRAQFFNKQKRYKKIYAENKVAMNNVTNQTIRKYDIWEDAAIKIKILTQRDERDSRTHVLEMKDLHRLLHADERNNSFIKTKNLNRLVLEQESVRKHRAFVAKVKALDDLLLAFKKAFLRILKLGDSLDLEAFFLTYKAQEQKNFAEFKYLTDLNHEVDVLEQSLQNLKESIHREATEYKKREHRSRKELRRLGRNVLEEQTRLDTVGKETDVMEEFLREVLQGVTESFDTAKCKNTAVIRLLGNLAGISTNNLVLSLTVLENRIEELKQEQAILTVRQGIASGALNVTALGQVPQGPKVQSVSRGGPFKPKVVLTGHISMTEDEDEEERIFSKKPFTKQEMVEFCLQKIQSAETGIAGGLVLILIEIFYKKHQLKRQRQLEIARHAADKWRQTIQQRKLNRSVDYNRRFKENGPPPFWAPGLDVRQRSPIAAKSHTIFV